MTTGVPPNAPHAARVIHRALVGGLLTISVVFLFLTFGVDVAPLLADGEGVSMIGYVLAAFGVIPILFAMLVLKPRVPQRTSGQTETAFWQEAFGPALLVWTLFEATGIIGAVGGLLTGLWAPVVLVGMALSCFFLFGPSSFENA